MTKETGESPRPNPVSPWQPFTRWWTPGRTDNNMPLPSAPTLTALTTSLHLAMRPALASFLDARNIYTLADICGAGGLGRIEGLPVGEDDPVISILEVHAKSQSAVAPFGRARCVTKRAAAPCPLLRTPLERTLFAALHD